MIPKYNLQYLDELNVAKKRVLEKQTQQLEVQKPKITDDMTIDPVLEDKKNRNKKSDNLLKEINNEFEMFNSELEVLIASILQKTGPGAPHKGTEKELASRYKKVEDNIVKANNNKADAIGLMKASKIDLLNESEYEELINLYNESKKDIEYGENVYTAKDIASYIKAIDIVIKSNRDLAKLEEEKQQINYDISLLGITPAELFTVKDVANSINDMLKKVLSKTITMKNKVSKNISSSMFYDKYDIQKFNNLASNFVTLFEDGFMKTFESPSDYIYKYSKEKYDEIFKKIKNNIIEIRRYINYGKRESQSTIQAPIMRGSGFGEMPKRNYM